MLKGRLNEKKSFDWRYKMGIEYFHFTFLINVHEYHCIWYTSEKDGFLTECNKLNYFTSIEKLQQFIEGNNIILNEDHAVLSIDEAKKWLDEKEKVINCNYFLNFWNCISDLAYSMGEKFYGDQDKGILNKIYNKLFYGNNLPAITPKGKKFFPEWNDEEIREITKVIKDGLRIVDIHIISEKDE